MDKLRLHKLGLGIVWILIITILPVVTVAGEVSNASSSVIRYQDMQPFLKSNDTVIYSNSTLFENLKTGDIIVFKAPQEEDKTLSIQIQLKEKQTVQNKDIEYEPYYFTIKDNNKFCDVNRITVSSVAEIGNFFNTQVIRTQGDANPYSIPGIDYPIFKENYIGKVVSVTHNNNTTIPEGKPVKTHEESVREFTIENQTNSQCAYNISDGTLKRNELSSNQWSFDGTLNAIIKQGTTKITKIFPFLATLSIKQVTETPDRSIELLVGRIAFGEGVLGFSEYENINGTLTIQGQKATLNLTNN